MRKSNVYIFFAALFMAMSLFTILFMINACTLAPVFKDYIIAPVGAYGINKNAEMLLIKLLTLLGSAASFMFCLKNTNKNAAKNETDDGKLFAAVILSTMLASLLLWKQNENFLLIAVLLLLCGIITFAFDKSASKQAFVFCFTALYAVFGIYRAFMYFGCTKPLDIKITVLCIGSVFAVLFLFKNRKALLEAASVLTQLFIPLVFFVYLYNGYFYNGQTIARSTPKRVFFLIACIMVGFIAENIYNLYAYFKKVKKEILTFGTCVSVMAFNSFYDMGIVCSLDRRHPYENIIGYFRVFERGEVPYGSYMPVSGLFSVVQGAFFKFFGGGRMMYFGLSESLFYLCVIFGIVYLLKKHTNAFYCFVFSTVFIVNEYNRYVFLLPFVLLLTLPGLIKKENLWLKVWFLTSLFYGLYYPSIGAAYCIGFMPLGLYLIYGMVKSGKLLRYAKKPGFYIGWAVCILPAVLSGKMLLGSLKHIKNMAKQTIYSDGYTRFAQSITDTFMPYLKNLIGLKMSIFDILTFTVPAAVVWAAIIIAARAGKLESGNRRLNAKAPVALFSVLPAAIIPAVCFNFTFVKLNINNIFARNDGIIFTSAIIMAIAAIKHFKGRAVYAVCAAAVILPCVGTHIFYDVDANELGLPNALVKLDGLKTIGRGVYINDGTVLDGCFIDEDIYAELEKYRKKTEKYDKNGVYTMIYPSFMHYYINNFKTAAAMESGTINGYDVTKETVELIEKQNAYVGDEFSPINNYYFYNYMLTSGKYVWSKDIGVFVPNKDNISAEESARMYLTGKQHDTHTALVENMASAMGDSMGALADIFTKYETAFDMAASENGADIVFEKEVYGDDADFLYVEALPEKNNVSYKILKGNDNDVTASIDIDPHEVPFAKHFAAKFYNDDKFLSVKWTGSDEKEHEMTCRLGKGRLLLPLGADPDWLLNKHGQISVSVLEQAKDGGKANVTLENITFLKLREINGE